MMLTALAACKEKENQDVSSSSVDASSSAVAVTSTPEDIDLTGNYGTSASGSSSQYALNPDGTLTDEEQSRLKDELISDINGLLEPEDDDE